MEKVSGGNSRIDGTIYLEMDEDQNQSSHKKNYQRKGIERVRGDRDERFKTKSRIC